MMHISLTYSTGCAARLIILIALVKFSSVLLALEPQGMLVQVQ